MAFTKFTKEDIYLLIREAMGESIGLYTFPSGHQEKAICYLPTEGFGFDYPPADTQIQGIECAIVCPLPQIKRLIGGDLQTIFTWQIFLKQWDNSVDVIFACNLLMNSLFKTGYPFKSPILIPPKEGLGALALARIDFFEVCFERF